MPGSQQFGVGSSPPPDTGQHQQKRSNIRNVEMVYLSDDEPLPSSNQTHNRECPAFLKQKRTKEAMAHLNVSFEEAEKIVDHPSYASLTSKNRYAPLMSSNTEFPSLPTKPTPPIHVTPQIPKSQWSNINDSQQKKRKIHHTEPQFPPVRREFQWSFCGKPVIDANNPQEVLTFQEIRDKLTSELSTNLTTLLQVHSRGDVDTVLDNFNLKSMIEALLRNIFQSYVQPSSEGGDFNGHHYLWGSTDNNSPGLTLVDAIDDFPHLIFRNEGQPTRLTRPSANISAVDVTIISTDLLDISTWTVMSDTYGSDHFPILMNINSTTTNIDSHSTYKWRIHPHPDWNRFADMVNPSLIWKRAKSIRKGISHQNSKTMSAEEAEVMLKKLAPDWATLPVSSTEPYYNHFLLEAVTVAEFDACIKNHDTAPGIDGITYSMIGNLPRRAKELLCVAFNKIVQTGDDCEALKKSVIIPISKADNLSSFRPISLMPCILKTLERILKNRLEWWLESKGICPKFQFGFRRGKGVMECLTNLVTDIQLSFSNNEYLSVIFLDISAAYDSVNPNILLQKMSHIGIPSLFAANLMKIFSERYIYISTGEHLVGPRNSSIGLPQGSVLSPLLFNIYSSDIHSLSLDTTLLQYADDFCLYTSKKTLSDCRTILNYAMRKVNKYLDENDLTLTYSKSAFVTYTRHRISPQDHITIGNAQIPWKKEHKYLGVTLDQKLTWDSHINNTIAKAEKSLNVLKTTARRHWGSDPQVALLFYKAYTRSILDFGAVFYGSASNTRLKKIERVQYKALRLVTGAMKPTLVQALLAECNEPPLFLRRRYLAQKAVCKIMANNDNSMLKKISHLSVQNLTNKYWIHKNSPPLTDAFTDLFHYDTHIIKNDKLPFFRAEFKVIYYTPNVIFPTYSDQPNMNNSILKTILAQYTPACHIYTDASKTADGVGCAFWIPSYNIKGMFKCNDISTIFNGEATAISKSLEYIDNLRGIKHYIIMTDSRSVLEALNSKHLYTHDVIKEILAKMYRLQQRQISVTLLWVKGHSGITGNLQADALAKNAISSDNIIDGIYIQDIIPSLRNQMRTAWERYYQEFAASHACHYTLATPQLPQPIFHKISTSRRNYVSILRYRFGIGNYKSLLHKMNLAPDPFCECDGSYGDLNHHLFSCRLNTDAVNYLVGILGSLGLLPANSVTVSYLLNTNIGFIHKFIAFLSQTKQHI
nr:unnamed protein product [Callosobruchus analis]